MPLLKYSEILGYSSEDPNHPAENLLKPDTYLKWKSKVGSNQKQEYAILKLEKLSTIKSIDIGNEQSAFVEVLVAREGIDYQVLLVASSFMTPLESRNSTNLNRVRMFGADKLNKDVADQKWDRLKIICTQPFIKNVQYGLTFIKSYGPDDTVENSGNLGKYALKEKDEDDNSITIGSFFAKRHEKEKETPLVGPAAIRAASKASTVITPQKRPHNETNTSFSSENQQLQKKFKGSPAPQLKNEPKAQKIQRREEKKGVPHESSKVKEIKKKESTSKTKCVRPFTQLMKDVIFVLSGYQNPKRGQLRDKLLEMGAKYKQDWEKGCTHLICAFKNTPKFGSVKGKGKIVKGEWVEDSYKKKTRLPWRRFNLESNKDAEESEEEIFASEISPKEEEKDDAVEDDVENDSEDTDDELKRALDEKDETADRKRGVKPTPTKNQAPPVPTMVGASGSPNCSSTKKDEDVTVAQVESDDAYDEDTDVDEESTTVASVKKLEKKDTSRLTLPPLKNFLKGQTFFIYGSLDESKKKALRRYIIHYLGEVLDYMDSRVKFVLTDDPWDKNFEEALDDNPGLQFVKSQWLWKCCDMERFVPPQPFLIVPEL